MRALLCLLLLALVGCGADSLVLIPGTTTRVGPVSQEKGTELELRIFREVSECVGAYIAGSKDDWERLSLCLPHVDRAAGEVRLGYQFRKDGEVVALPVSKDQLTVIHQGTIIQSGRDGQDFTVIPHDPQQVNQLYVLLIDGSSSMAEMANQKLNRMEQVKAALRLREVQDAFFPDEVKTGVLLMQFTSGEPRPVGGQITLLENRRQYLDAVAQLQVLSGFTHFYDAVAWAAGPMLDVEAIRRFVEVQDMAITVIALTDGFNNIKGADLCRDNATRLEGLIRMLKDVQEAEGTRLVRRPRVYTVGLGKPIRPSFELPDDWDQQVKPKDLCGRFAERRIDSDLEVRGIDNPSLLWIARAGNGDAFVKQGRDGLGQAFASSAARRYGWFEVRYRVDPFYLRRAFTTRLRLTSYHSAEATVRLHPSAWLDAPPGKVGDDGWTGPRSYGHTMVVLTPLLSLLIALGYVGAAGFNTRRALFGRTRRRKRG